MMTKLPFTSLLATCLCLLATQFSCCVDAFSPNYVGRVKQQTAVAPKSPPTLSRAALFSSSNDEEFGGFTVKQRLREEVESPFRKVRFWFFLSSAGSALTALYFSALSIVKANIGGYEDAIPMEEALTSSAINLAGALVCGALAFREYKVGQANLQRIKKGGQLAKLVVQPASDNKALTLSDYRRSSRVMIAAGGASYISDLCRQLNADQLQDENTLPEAIESVDVVIVPVLLEGTEDVSVAMDTKAAWLETSPEEGDRNFDVGRANNVIAFPRGRGAWSEYLESEIETAASQGFDVLSKGFTILVKKNGRILRRATGLPQWSGMLGTMEVMDGSKFGMPGDDEKYGSS